MTVRRLTQTEFNSNDVRRSKLNESMIDQLEPAKTMIYKKLVYDYGIDESVAAFACLQTSF